MKINDIPTDQWYQIFLDCMNGVHKKPLNYSRVDLCYSTTEHKSKVWLDRYCMNHVENVDQAISILSFENIHPSLVTPLNDMLYVHWNKPLSQKATEYLDETITPNPVEGVQMIYRDVLEGNKFIIAINTLDDGKSLKDHPEQYHLFVQDTKLDRFVKISPT